MRHERLIELLVVQANDVVTQPSRSGLAHHEPLPAVNTESLLGVPDVAANSNEKHSLRPFSMYGTKVGVTSCTASIYTLGKACAVPLNTRWVQCCIGAYMTAALFRPVQ